MVRSFKHSLQRGVAALAVGALVLSACGGGDDADDGAADDVTDDAAADPTSPDDGADDAPDDTASDDGSDDGADDGDAPSGDRAPGWAGELVMRTTDSVTMDPAKLPTESSLDWDRAAAIFDTLMLWDASNDIVPQLAESMETEDGIVWTLKLRPDINFTDGTPLDAEAVVFNIERQRDPANACGCAGNLANVESIDIIDPLTVQFTLSSPDGSFIEGFSGINGMMGSPTAIQADPEGFGSSPVGAGPYILEEYARDDHLDLVRNPDYWDPEHPAYETVHIRFLPDAIATAEALRAGEFDVAFTGGAEVLVQLGDPEPYGLRVERSDGITFVLMNHSKGAVQDVRVREAIALAFDPARVNAALLNGLWESEELVCPPYFESDPECLPGLWPAFDPERAASLVAEYAAEGNSVDVTVLGSQGRESEMEFIQQALNNIGLNATLNMVPGAEWITAVNAGDFELTWYAVGLPVNPRMHYLFASDQRDLPRANNPEYDEVVRTGRTSIDPDERLAAWHRMQEIIAETYMMAWYAPFVNGYVLREDIDYGDQLRSVKLHISQLAPAE